MLKKFGVNSTRAEKHCPVKTGAVPMIERVVICSCGKRFVKSCPNSVACEVSTFTCPHCGAILS
jgi:hypothetical protein